MHPAIMWLINTDLDTTKRYRPKMGSLNHNVLLPESQKHVINPTNPRGALDDGIQNRLHVSGRAADDAKHLGCCRLMLQGFAQFGVTLLDLFEQPDVFYGDHRLVSEGFEELDLLIRERPDLHPAKRNHADRNTFAQQRHRESCSGAASPATSHSIDIREFYFRFGLDVRDVNRLPFNHGATDV